MLARRVLRGVVFSLSPPPLASQVGEKIGEARQSAQVQRRNDELAELVRAARAVPPGERRAFAQGCRASARLSPARGAALKPGPANALACQMRAAHKKLGLEGTSDPVDVAGPDSDWASRFDSGVRHNQSARVPMRAIGRGREGRPASPAGKIAPVPG